MKTTLRKLVKEINVKRVVAEELTRMGIPCEGIDNYVKIEDYETLMLFTKLIIDPERINQAVLCVNTKGNSYYRVLEKSEGNQVTNFSKFEAISVKTPDGTVTVGGNATQKATKTFQQLSFSQNAVQDGTLKEIVEYGYYSNLEKGEAFIVRTTINGEVRIKSLCDGVGNYNKYSEEEANKILEGCEHYAFFTSTNAEMKHSGASAVNVNHHDPEELLDQLSFGAYAKAKKELADKEIKMIDLAKALPRFGQQKSPSGKIEPCLNRFGYIILKDSIKMHGHKKFDYEGNPQSEDFDGYNVIDGSCFTREDYEAVLLSIKLIQKGLKVIVDPKATRGTQTQFRIWTFKGTKLSTRYSAFQRLLENIEDRKVEGKDYVIVGNRRNIVNIMDSDTVKSVFGVFPDFERFIDAKIFTMALAKPSIISTSKYQMLNKIAACENVDFEKLAEYIKEAAETTARKNFGPMLDDVEKTESMVRLDTLNTGFINDTLRDMTNGRALHSDYSLLTKYLRNLNNTIKNQVGGIRLDLEGKSTYGMLAHDVTALLVRPKYREACFGENEFGIIGYKEVFCKQWNNKVIKAYKAKRMKEARETVDMIRELKGEEEVKKFLKATRESIKEEVKNEDIISRDCFMVKFPAPGLNEVYKAKLLSEYDIKERALKIATKLHAIDPKVNIEKEARLLADNILDVTPGTILMPALEPLKAFLAGFDDDGDAAALVWNEKLTKFFLEVKDIMVSIDTNDMGNDVSTVSRQNNKSFKKDEASSLIDKIRNM